MILGDDLRRDFSGNAAPVAWLRLGNGHLLAKLAVAAPNLS